MATWLHCLVKDGSVVACSEDKDFNIDDSLSSDMKSKFFHIKVVESLEDCIPLSVPNEVAGVIIDKFKYYIDIDNFFKDDAALKSDIIDAKVEVAPLDTIQLISVVSDRSIIEVQK